MDFGTLIMAVIVISIITLPFILIGRSNKIKKQKMVDALVAMAKSEGNTISQSECVGDFAVGIDKGLHTLYFYKKIKDRESHHKVDLEAVQTCTLINNSRNIQMGDGNNKIIDSLALKFTFKDKSRPDYLLEFYNGNDSVQLSGELQAIEKWDGLINQKLKS
ncbi:MAG: hypothetical protein IPN29_05495 [Saprospiraceae bacterium]|nr:hypothetical protein [Saprospiraceae bacterium]